MIPQVSDQKRRIKIFIKSYLPQGLEAISCMLPDLFRDKADTKIHHRLLHAVDEIKSGISNQEFLDDANKTLAGL